MPGTPRPLDHPAAWLGGQLSSREEWQLTFTDAELDELLLAARKIADSPALAELDELQPLPRLQNKLQFIQDALENGSGVVRLGGFPADSLTLEVARHAFWLLARHLGTPVSQSATGERIFHVQDAGWADKDSRARGPNTRKKLSFHTDRCDVIGFLCYRQAKSGGENEIVSSMTLYNQMLQQRPDLLAVLMQPYRYQRHNVDTANDLPYVQQPIFSFCEGHFAANLLRVLIERAYATPGTPAMSELQLEALDTLEELAEQSDLHLRFRQQPGDILLLNNFVTLHRRAEFVDYDQTEQKRLLLRIWLSMPNSRPLDPLFAGNYGATAAGAIRGGMQPA